MATPLEQIYSQAQGASSHGQKVGIMQTSFNRNPTQELFQGLFTQGAAQMNQVSYQISRRAFDSVNLIRNPNQDGGDV